MAEQDLTRPAAAGPVTWQPAPETDGVRAGAAGLGVLRLARQEPGRAGETLRGAGLAAGSAIALVAMNAILSSFGDAGWVSIFRALLIVLVAGVLIGLIRAVRGLVRARMAVYVYDFGVVGAARGRTRTIRWEQVTQLVVLSTEGVHIVAEQRPMIVPANVVGGPEDRTQFLNAVVPPLQQRGVEILRF